MAVETQVRLTQYAHGGGCACKIPPGELEEAVARLIPARRPADLLIGVEHGDDAAVVQIAPDRAVVATADFFTPVVDDAYTFGQIAAANALSDVYAVGGEPLVALNLLGWPRDVLSADLAAEVLRGGLDMAASAGCHVAGGHSIDDPEPKYGMAVTGLADPAALLRIDAGRPGLPLSLTKPIGSGVLNSRHKATGEVFPAAIEVMTTLNAQRQQAGAGGRHHVRHRRDRLRPARPPVQAGQGQRRHRGARQRGGAADRRRARRAARPAYVPGGSRRNLDWVAPHADFGTVSEDQLLLLADAQTSGGLLVAGEIPGAPVIGDLVERAGPAMWSSASRPASRAWPRRARSACRAGSTTQLGIRS